MAGQDSVTGDAASTAKDLQNVIGVSRSEGWFRSLVENASDVIAILEADGTVRYVNPAIEQMLGYLPEKKIGRSAFELLHPEDLPQAREVFAEAFRSPGVTFTIEVRMRHKDGSWRHVEVRGKNLLEDPSVGAIVLNWRDITARKRVEKLLTEERYRTLMETMPVIIYIQEPSDPSRTTYISPQYEKILGHPQQECLEDPEHWVKIMHPEDRERVLAEDERTNRTGEPFSMEYRQIARDGRVVWVRDEAAIVRDKDGNLSCWIGVQVDVTKRKEVEKALEESEKRLRVLFENSSDMISLVNPDNTLRYISPSVRRLLGYEPEELEGTLVSDLVHPEDFERFGKAITEQIQSGISPSRPVQGRYRHKNGSWRHLETAVNILIDDPSVRGVVCTTRDVTERVRAEETLRISERRFRALTQNSSDIITLLHADGTIRYESSSIERILGYRPEELVGKSAFDYVHPDDLERVLGAFAEGLAYPDLHPSAEYRFRHKDGSWRWMESVGSNSLDEPDVGELVVNSRDVTERRAIEEELRYQAFQDLLTGLPNRRLFVDRLGQALRSTRRKKGRQVAVLFLDLDDFKAINDSLGHRVGDLLLVLVAERLRRCLRPEDTLARFGGDEFVILIEGVKRPEEAIRVAERLVESLRAPFLAEGREMFLRTSIGIALGTSRQKSPEDLLRDADTAMYEAKEEGSGYRVFDQAMYLRALKRLELENDIKRAIEREEFVVHYQPIVSLSTGEVRGMEALVRWNHPSRGLLDPSEFVALTERSGFVIPMGEQVLEEACRRAKEWQEKWPSSSPLIISVNLSARQLHRPELSETVERVLRKTGLEADRLSLDITETVYVKALEDDTSVLDGLKQRGVSISIDDFGVGYSSLSYLKRLPADALKIDKSFIVGLGEDAEATAIVQMVIELAHTLGMEIIAEGVESAEQVDLLKEMGCDKAQGYHFSRPLPLEEVPTFLGRIDI